MLKFHWPTKIIFIVLAAIIVAALALITLRYSQLKQGTPMPGLSGQNQNSDIVVSSPGIHQALSSPVALFGKVKGSWFFEGSFPVKVLDEDGTVLGSVAVTAQGNWQTQDFVNFSGNLSFVLPKGKTGALLFENDNPSGLPQNHKEFKMPISFTSQTSSQPKGTCSPDNSNCKGNPELCMTENLNKVCD